MALALATLITHQRAQAGEPDLDALCRAAGPSLSTARTRALGGIFAKYEDHFAVHEARLWAADGADWAKANFYDRVRIYYASYCRSGDAKYLERADAIARDYRDRFIAKDYGPAAHWSEMDGLAWHYLATGDEQSRVAIGKVADYFASNYYMKNLGNPAAEMDNRMQAKVLQAFMAARLVKAPSTGNKAWQLPGGNDWDRLLRQAVDSILASQAGDGAYRFAAYGYFVKPFMLGMLNTTLIKYHDTVEQDPRVRDSIKRSADYLWLHDWIAPARSFIYLEKDYKEEKAEPAPVLNALIVPAFGWLYKQTGDKKYRERGDQILAGAVSGAWLESGKQFNQLFSTSYLYLGYRGAEPTGGAPR